MANWIRIFGTNDRTPCASEIVEFLLRSGFQLTSEVCGENDDWEQVTLAAPRMKSPVMVERTPLDDPEISDEVEPLLEGLRTVDDLLDVDQIEDVLAHTRQLFIIGVPGGLHRDKTADRLSTTVSQFLATETKGIYQIDEQGFFDAKGALLLEEQ